MRGGATEVNDLTLGLAIVGGIALAGVVAHGAWQARRAGPRRAEPAVPAVPGAGVQLEPVMDAGGAELELPVAQPRRPVARLDALIDAIANLRPEAELGGETILAHLPPTRRVGSKPWLVEGLNAASGEWEPIAPGQTYRELQAGVQLANRSGALNEIEYSEFAQRVQALAEALGAMAELPDMLDAVARARELDAFAGAHDAQLALRLSARSVAWAVGYVQQAAARLGFVAGAVAGRMVLPAAAEGDPPLLVLAVDAHAALADAPEASAVRELTLSLDVAQTDAALQTFDAWRSQARALAQDMDAQIVDDQGRPLEDAGFEAIAGELERLYATLAGHGLPAGSPAARRLFS